MSLFKQGLNTTLPDNLFNFDRQYKLNKTDNLGELGASLVDCSHFIRFKRKINYGSKKQKMESRTI